MSESATIEDRAGSILKREVLTVDSSETLGNALKMMLKENVGSLVVKENRKPVSIVTERDFVRVCAETSDVRCFKNKVRAVMSTPLTIEP